jgi:hypothetical protein
MLYWLRNNWSTGDSRHQHQNKANEDPEKWKNR